MTPAQKTAQANFKKAIAYRKKTGCSLKQAFAHVKSGKVSGLDRVIKKDNKTAVLYTKQVKKKAAPKKKTAKKKASQGVLFGTKKKAAKKTVSRHKDIKSHNVKISVMSGFFDTTVIKDIDALRKQYFQLAKKYHPDAGGTTEQMQLINDEHEKLLKKLLSGSKLTDEQQKNEIEIDETIKIIIDNIIGLEGINIEVIGKWLWVSGNTYPVRSLLKDAGLTFIKKAGAPYWVYKGVESSGRGKASIEEIRAKYGTHKFDQKPPKKINGISKIKSRSKIYTAIRKLTKAVNKRPI